MSTRSTHPTVIRTSVVVALAVVVLAWSLVDIRRVWLPLGDLGYVSHFDFIISYVQPHSPAAQAGLQAGDVIVAVDGHEVADARAILYRLTTRGVGNRCRLDIVRKGRQLSLEVALRAAPQAGNDDVRNLSGAHPFDGVRVSNILPAIAEELGLEEEDGVVILQVRPDSKAARIGFQPGDVIQQVGRKKIETVGELEAVLRERQQVWLVQFKRGNQSVRLQLAG